MNTQMVKTKFTFDDMVVHRLTKEKGIIAAITFESELFYVYTVIYADRVQQHKESELELTQILLD